MSTGSERPMVPAVDRPDSNDRRDPRIQPKRKLPSPDVQEWEDEGGSVPPAEAPVPLDEPPPARR